MKREAKEEGDAGSDRDLYLEQTKKEEESNPRVSLAD